jgi:peptidoglycan/LPS O-acetylase OafA/YrhL
MTLEFSAGVLIFRFKERIGRRSFILSSCLVIVLSPIIFLTDYSFNSGGLGDVYTIINSPWLGMIRLSIWGTTAVLLVVTVVGAEHIFKIAWPKILTKFGDASYSLYLIQPYGFVLIGKMEVHKPLENWEKVLIWIGFSTALCIPLRQMVETPITEFVKNALNRKTKRGVIYV